MLISYSFFYLYIGDYKKEVWVGNVILIFSFYGIGKLLFFVYIMKIF